MKKVFFLLVKRLQELQCHKNNYNNTKESKLNQPLLKSDQNGDIILNEKSSAENCNLNETFSEGSMGSNVTTAKGGLSGRRTQSQSKFSITKPFDMYLNVSLSPFMYMQTI